MIGVNDPLASAAAVVPDAALAALETYPPAVHIRAVSQRAISERDPDAVRAIAESMLAGQERDQLLSYVAESWVQRDPDAAVAWVESLDPPSSLARSALIEGLALVDFDRAVEIALGDDTVGSLVTRLPLEQHLDRLPALMDRLLAAPRGRGVRSLVANTQRDGVLGRWATYDPEGALRWLGERGNDPAQALSWIEQVRGRQGEGWVTTIVETVAARAPEAAASLLRTGGASVRRNTPYVARSWAQRDPVRASEWAASLAEPAERDAAAAMIAAQWASVDAEAARRWAFAAAGSMRDAAIAALFENQLRPLGGLRTVDSSLLDAIGDRATSQRLVRVAVPTLARDPEQARELSNGSSSIPRRSAPRSTSSSGFGRNGHGARLVEDRPRRLRVGTQPLTWRCSLTGLIERDDGGAISVPWSRVTLRWRWTLPRLLSFRGGARS